MIWTEENIMRTAYLGSLDGQPPLEIDGFVTIGSDSNNQIVLKDPLVSPAHCRLEKRPSGFFIRDLKSDHGIFVNGLRVMEAELINGCQIQIGQKYFQFLSERPEVSDDIPIKTRNPIWKSTLLKLKNFAQLDLPIFLQGESGVGKEVIARIIHDLSPRGEEPFVSVNCSALTESLVESELFGHVKGSFTGATSDRKGAFEAARGGTLFLDEIGDLPPSLQPKLLRALENSEIKPVGSDKVLQTNVRVITATHKCLEQMVADREFRQDLYFRIQVLKVSIPSLRDRMEDFEDLLYFFCREYRVRFSVAAIEELKRHTWPGNIRELKNTAARARALFPGTYIQPEHIAQLIDAQIMVSPRPLQEPPKSGSFPVLKEIEKEIIRTRLLANQGNQRKTAAELGMPKSTLHDRIKAYHIEVKSLLNV